MPLAGSAAVHALGQYPMRFEWAACGGTMQQIVDVGAEREEASIVRPEIGRRQWRLGDVVDVNFEHHVRVLIDRQSDVGWEVHGTTADLSRHVNCNDDCNTTHRDKHGTQERTAQPAIGLSTLHSCSFFGTSATCPLPTYASDAASSSSEQW